MTTVLAIWRFLGVRGAIAAGLALALAFVMWRADSLSERLERAKGALVAEQTAHGLTRASLALLEQRHAAIVADGRARDERVAEVRVNPPREVVVIRRDIERLATAVAVDPCVTPVEVMGAGL